MTARQPDEYEAVACASENYRLRINNYNLCAKSHHFYKLHVSKLHTPYSIPHIKACHQPPSKMKSISRHLFAVVALLGHFVTAEYEVYAVEEESPGNLEAVVFDDSWVSLAYYYEIV
jgi:hypothetical protein